MHTKLVFLSLRDSIAEIIVQEVISDYVDSNATTNRLIQND